MVVVGIGDTWFAESRGVCRPTPKADWIVREYKVDRKSVLEQVEAV